MFFRYTGSKTVKFILMGGENMLRKILESIVGPMSDLDFHETLELATDDIRINRVGFNQRTSLPILVDISVSCYRLVQRIKKAAS